MLIPNSFWRQFFALHFGVERKAIIMFSLVGSVLVSRDLFEALKIPTQYF